MLKKLNNNKGAISVLGVGTVLVMLGVGSLVVDLGYMALNKHQLQTAADQAALAAATSTNNSIPDVVGITATAKRYAAQNPGSSSDTTSVAVDIKSAGVMVTVTTERSVPTFIAAGPPVKMTATARAIAVPVNTMPSGYVAPFLITEPKNLNWSFGNGDYTNPHYMKKTPQSQDDFTYANAIFKKGKNEDENRSLYWTALEKNVPQKLSIDSPYYFWSDATGSELALEKFSKRLRGNNDIKKCKPGDPRLMMVPVVEKLPNEKTFNHMDKITSDSPYRITGFIGFWLDSVEKGTPEIRPDGKYYPNFKISGRFVKVNVPVAPIDGNSTSIPRFFGLVNIYLVPNDWTWPTT